MDRKTFYDLALNMRRLQKEFFRTPARDRRPNLVVAAKVAERRFDEALAELMGVQAGLFDRVEDGDEDEDDGA